MTAFTYLSNRSLLEITGNDAFNFLQGMLTNDISSGSAHSIVYSLMLNPQGRFLYDFFIMHAEKAIYLDHNSAFTKEIIEKLNFYKMRSDVHIVDLAGVYSVLFLENLEGPMIFQDPRSDKLGKRAYINNAHLEEFIATLIENRSMYLDIIFKHLVPEPHQDMIQGKSFPLEYGMDIFHSISFNKGCYIGQETTARIKHSGVIRKKLTQCTVSQDLSGFKLGDSITLENHTGVFCAVHEGTVRILEFLPHLV